MTEENPAGMSENRRFNRFAGEVGGSLSRAVEEADSLAAVDQEIFGAGRRELAALENGTVEIGSYRLTPLGLTAPMWATKDEWRMVGSVLRKMGGALQWAVGDWANSAISHLDEWVTGEISQDTKYKVLMHETDYAYQSIRDMVWVAGAIPLSLRKDTLSYNHHKLFAKYGGDLLALWLEYADRTRLSVSSLREEMTYLEYKDETVKLDWLQYALKTGQRLSEIAELVNERPTLSRLIPRDAEKDWNYLRSFSARVHTPGELFRAREKIRRLRALLDEIESNLK